MRMTFGEYVKQLRGSRTQGEIAERAGLSVQFLSDIERGARYPSATATERLASSLGVSVADLVACDPRQSARRVAELAESPGEVGDLVRSVLEILPGANINTLRAIAKAARK